MNLAALGLQRTQQFSLVSGARIVARQNVGRRTFVLRLFNGPLGLQIKVLQKQFAVVIEIIERNQQRCLLVIIVVALGPTGFRQRRVLFVPRALILGGRQGPL